MKSRVKVLVAAVLVCMFAGMALMVASCNDGVSMGKDENGEEVGEKLTLFDTRWQLEGFFDVEEGELRKPEPEDCENCYTLDFAPDITIPQIPGSNAAGYWLFVGKGILTGPMCFYVADYTHSTVNIVGEMPRGGLVGPFDDFEYEQALKATYAFDLKNDKLKLFYGDLKNYLLFKRIEGHSNYDWNIFFERPEERLAGNDSLKLDAELRNRIIQDYFNQMVNPPIADVSLEELEIEKEYGVFDKHVVVRFNPVLARLRPAVEIPIEIAGVMTEWSFADRIVAWKDGRVFTLITAQENNILSQASLQKILLMNHI
ncbi:MAG: hypothetical protein LBC84_09755 [Prevotellaceae bacterium]|jgi:hypothetical protein|nr:hypothetical protein [Prevotellaceae bacterium]